MADPKCFLVDSREEHSLVKNVLNVFCETKCFGEIVEDIVLDSDGNYEVSEVLGIASWGPKSKDDLIKVFGFTEFTGIRFFYDYDWVDGIRSSEFQDIQISELKCYLIDALSWNSQKYLDNSAKNSLIIDSLNKCGKGVR